MSVDSTVQAAPVGGHTATRSHARRQRLANGVALLVMALLGIMFMFPWFWTLSTSLKRPAELFIFPPLWVPEQPQVDNYLEVFRQVPFGLWYFNSIVVVVLSTVGVLITATLVAYSFARFRWPGRNLLFAITLGTMMLPSEVVLIPRYILFKNLSWLNTTLPLWVPAWFGGSAFIIFLMRQFILSLPRDFDEAATIDGANPWQIFIRVHLPMAKPALATLGVFTFMTTWGAVLEPTIYLTSPENFTLPIGVMSLQGQYVGNDNLVTAAALMSLVPVLLVFLVAQRYFVRGVMSSGVKG